MGGTNLWNRVAGNFSSEAAFPPKVPLIEIYGGKRILIENHCGVCEYTENLICVKVKHGQVCVGGYNLKLALICKDRLVICGKIESVHIKEA